MTPSLEITIPSTSIRNQPKPHTVYLLSLRLPLRSFTIQKRYSEFVKLHADLTAQTASQTPPPLPLPPKHYFTSTLRNDTLTEERRKGLETYLQTLADPTKTDSRWRDTQAWRAFLNLPNSSSSAKSSSSRGVGAGTASAARGNLRTAYTQGGNSSASDPAVWLDTHRELSSLLQTAREHLAARSKASTAGSATSNGPVGHAAKIQAEEGAAAKKALVKAGTLIVVLEKGLKGLGDEWGERERLGEGEMRRRRDLLAAARREKERLEEVQVMVGRKEGVEGEIVEQQQRQQEAQGQGNGQAANNAAVSHKRGPSVGKGRTLGKETDITRELDNQGVVGLQQQMMKEQDEDLDIMAKALRRQKELAMQINEELEVHNEELTLLDEDVDRVQAKTKIASKRADKIK